MISGSLLFEPILDELSQSLVACRLLLILPFELLINSISPLVRPVCQSRHAVSALEHRKSFMTALTNDIRNLKYRGKGHSIKKLLSFGIPVSVKLAEESFKSFISYTPSGSHIPQSISARSSLPRAPLHAYARPNSTRLEQSETNFCVMAIAERPRGKIRGNRDSALPVEAWAKGLSKAFSRKKSFSTKPHHNDASGSIPDVPAMKPFGHSVTISSPGSTSISPSPQTKILDHASNRPIEDWMKTLPQRTPGFQPRSPLRLSTYGRPSTSKSNFTLNSAKDQSPVDSASIPTDWASDFERDLPSLNPFYEEQLSDLADTSLNLQKSAQSETSNTVLPLSINRPSQHQPDSIPATEGDNNISLRSLFFPGSNESRENPTTLSVTSSNVAGRPRPLSTVSSIESFATANNGSDYAIEDDIVEEDNNDMGIDEDYTAEEEDIDERNETSRHIVQEQLLDLKVAQETIIELQAVDHATDFDMHSDSGTLEDILVQIALSSPYASSDSDISSQAGIQEESQSHRAEDLPNETSTQKGSSLPDTESLGSPISISSGSILEYQQVRPGRHYKMINGIIVQYDPWRIPGQPNAPRLSSSSSGARDLPLGSSNCKLQDSRIFLQSGDSWTYNGLPVGVTA